MEISLEDLPDELFTDIIFKNLDVVSFINFCMTSKKYYKYSKEYDYKLVQKERHNISKYFYKFTNYAVIRNYTNINFIIYFNSYHHYEKMQKSLDKKKQKYKNLSLFFNNSFYITLLDMKKLFNLSYDELTELKKNILNR